MGVYLFKLALFGMSLLFGLVAIFLGSVTAYAAISNGELTYIIGRISTTVSRSDDPSGFWRSLMLWSVLPIVGGAAAVWFGRRGLSKL
jgi:hypothetical protein